MRTLLWMGALAMGLGETVEPSRELAVAIVRDGDTDWMVVVDPESPGRPVAVIVLE